MSYGLKYTIEAQAKNEPTALTYTVNIYEKDYIGSSYPFDPATNPMQGQILSGSDEPFDPIVSTSLTLTIDITDFDETLLPDFTTNDDRKYWVKMYASGTTYLVWQGFIIMESVTVPFTTGRLFLQMICTDGLALLKSIPYVPTDPDINIAEDLSTTITNCLNKLSLPDGYYINYCAGYYATGMDTHISMFKQAYYPVRNWLNNDLTYKSCYQVLEEICTSTGSQIFQSNGEWWIASVNERAEDQIRFFRTTNANGVESIVIRWKQREIAPYQNPTDSQWYFIDNEQTKIIRKGYPIIELNHDLSFAPQCIDNGTFSRITGGLPDNWTVTLGTGTGTIEEETYNGVTGFEFFCGTNTTILQPNSIAPVRAANKLLLSFALKAIPITGLPGIKLEIRVTTSGGDFYNYRNDIDLDRPEWDLNATAGRYDVDLSSDQLNNISITIPSPPAEGVLTIKFIVLIGATSQTAFLANVRLTYQSLFEKQVITSKVNTLSDYKKTVQIPLGSQSNSDETESGSLLDNAGALLTGWYRYGVSEIRDSLMRIIAQQYSNVQSKGVININSTTKGLFDNRDNIDPIVKQVSHIIGPIDTETVTDSGTGPLSVDGKYYIFGASTFNYIDDTYNGIILETSNVDVTSTFTDTLIVAK